MSSMKSVGGRPVSQARSAARSTKVPGVPAWRMTGHRRRFVAGPDARERHVRRGADVAGDGPSAKVVTVSGGSLWDTTTLRPR